MFYDRWYKRAEGDSTCKNKSKEKIINFKSFKASSSSYQVESKSSLKIWQLDRNQLSVRDYSTCENK